MARLVCIGGLSGSGKSTLGRALAERIGPARIIDSDVERKALFGLGPFDRLPEGAYAPDISARVYDGMLRHARAALADGKTVIVTALHNFARGRTAYEDMARAEGHAFQGFWLDTQAGTLKARIAARRNDASDAAPAVIDLQLKEETGDITWPKIDAGQSPESVLRAALGILG